MAAAKPGQRGASMGTNGLMMGGRRDHKLDEKKRARAKKAVENSITEPSTTGNTVQAEGKPA